MIGKQIRMERIINPHTKRTVIVPMDHGVSVGPITGIGRIKDVVKEVAMGGADSVILHKGMIKAIRDAYTPDLALIVHLSASTNLSPQPNNKLIVSTVEEAIRLGADGVSVHVNLGNEHEKEMLKDLSRVADEAEKWGIPLLAMMYPRGEKVKNEYDPNAIAHAARLGAELGADIVKVSYTGDQRSFSKVVEGANVPVVIAGGPKMGSDMELLKMVRDAIEAGAAGTSIGRNVFQHESPMLMTKAISMVVHKGATVEEAMEILWETKEVLHASCG